MAKKNKSLIINGVGTFFGKNPANDKLVSLGSLQSLKFDFSITEDPVYGGDGMFPIDYVTTDKSVVAEAVNAKFDLNSLRLITGASITEAENLDAYTWALNEKHTVSEIAAGDYEDWNLVVTDAASSSGDITIDVDGTDVVVAILDSDTTAEIATKIAAELVLDATVNADFVVTSDGSVVNITAREAGDIAGTVVGFTDTDTTNADMFAEKITDGSSDSTAYTIPLSYGGASIFSTPEISVMDEISGDAFDEITDGEPATGEFKLISGDTKLQFNADMEGRSVITSYKKNGSDITLAEGLKTDMPIPLKIIHQGAFKQKDDTWQGVETEIKLAKASGTFTVDFARATASTPTLTLNMIDPEDGTCRLWTMKRFVTVAPPCV
jgi:hypothetical protein